MKALIILSLLLTSSLMASNQPHGEKQPRPEKPQISPEKPRFPKHWGHPPRLQVRDHVKLPGKFGEGSSTLAKWIADNLKRDANKERPGKEEPNPQPKPKPKPKPPGKPTPPIVPLPPVEVKEKIDLYRKGQKIMHSGLKEKIESLGKKPSREDVRKTVEKYKKDNEQLIESQKELAKEINKWHKDSKPERPARPEPSTEVKAKLATVKEKQKELDIIRKAFHEKLKDSKELTKDQRTELVKEFKEANADKHRAVKEAQKELQKEIRQKIQTGDRRE